ncbi:hypothetical protein BDV96DRAFT_398831 [Lophiotrema nucula]|uniref:Uncharacterized protein n=1 Tax=Lophiotrema nucula TaxID=690887 RepID=A0A6A5ZEV6_9PLEO|nr:hypothetical protein BDV96DRAFT_398831 [Lophiotrema nucula]
MGGFRRSSDTRRRTQATQKHHLTHSRKYTCSPRRLATQARTRATLRVHTIHAVISGTSHRARFSVRHRVDRSLSRIHASIEQKNCDARGEAPRCYRSGADGEDVAMYINQESPLLPGLAGDGSGSDVHREAGIGDAGVFVEPRGCALIATFAVMLQVRLWYCEMGRSFCPSGASRHWWTHVRLMCWKGGERE